MDYRLIITVNSDKDHPPIRLTVGITEEIAKVLMATPVKTVSLAVEGKPPHVGKLPLLDFR